MIMFSEVRKTEIKPSSSWDTAQTSSPECGRIYVALSPNSTCSYRETVHQGVRARFWCTSGLTLREVRTHSEAVVWSGEWWGGPVCVAGLVAAVVVSSVSPGLGAPSPRRSQSGVNSSELGETRLTPDYH